MITWFNQPYLKSQIKKGETYRFFGKMQVRNGVKQLNSPVFDVIEKNNNTGKIIPVYPLNYEIKANTIRKIIQNGLELAGELEEIMPDYILNKYKLMSYNDAIKQIHFPKDFDYFRKARKRLVFDELLTMQLGLLKLKGQNNKQLKGIKYDENVNMSDVINDLPFKLTRAQLNVLEDINSDMEKENQSK